MGDTTSPQALADKAARHIAALVPAEKLREDDTDWSTEPLTAIPLSVTSKLGSGYNAVLDIARSIEHVGVMVGRPDEGMQYEIGRTLEELGAAIRSQVSQPRDHPVPCRVCRESTWNRDGFCDNHTEITG